MITISSSFSLSKASPERHDLPEIPILCLSCRIRILKHCNFLQSFWSVAITNKSSSYTKNKKLKFRCGISRCLPTCSEEKGRGKRGRIMGGSEHNVKRISKKLKFNLKTWISLKKQNSLWKLLKSIFFFNHEFKKNTRIWILIVLISKDFIKWTWVSNWSQHTTNRVYLLHRRGR